MTNNTNTKTTRSAFISEASKQPSAQKLIKALSYIRYTLV
jgi:hypothetical protein